VPSVVAQQKITTIQTLGVPTFNKGMCLFSGEQGHGTSIPDELLRQSTRGAVESNS
jgi:hypothetical protein